MAVISRTLRTVNFGDLSREIAMHSNDILEKDDDDFDPSSIEIPNEYNTIVDFAQNKLTDEEGHAIDDIHAIFLTGKAGTGKSTAIKYIKHMIPNSVVVAPTTIAAMNVKGSTIHSFFGFPPSIIDPSEIKEVDGKKVPVLQALDLLIVDEVSMVSSAMVDCMHEALKLAKNNHKPFGGVKMLFVGDLFQLPPIVEDEEVRKYFAGIESRYDSEFFFSADIFKHGCEMFPLELKVVKRQNADASTDNAQFVEALNAIRTNNSDCIFGCLGFLNEKCYEAKKQQTNVQQGSIALVPTKAKAKEFNKTQIDKIQSEYRAYKGQLVDQMYAELIKQFQAPDELELKVGAQVVFVTNNKPEWINGDLGLVTDLGKDVIKVKIIKSGIVRDVKRADFGKYKYKYNAEKKKLEKTFIKAFVQFPLALGWAITIHKSQGMTLENVIVDIDGSAFADGQTYVALSRATSIEGLQLKTPLQFGDVKVSDQILKAYAKLFPEDYHYEN